MAEYPIIGWREWLAFPQWNVSHVKAKVDTGARSSALHAFDIQFYEKDGLAMARFAIHPFQRVSAPTLYAEAPVIDTRSVRSTSGHQEARPVIRPKVQLGPYLWEIDLTLTNRDAMGFRMLLGREAVRRRFVVDPGASFLIGKPPKPKTS